jgi:hypothetical protein
MKKKPQAPVVAKLLSTRSLECVAAGHEEEDPYKKLPGKRTPPTVTL